MVLSIVQITDVSTENVCHGVKYRMSKKPFNPFPEICSIGLRKNINIINILHVKLHIGHINHSEECVHLLFFLYLLIIF